MTNVKSRVVRVSLCVPDERCIVKCEEQINEDVTLAFREGDHHRADGTLIGVASDDKLHGHPLRQMTKISLHTSDRSGEVSTFMLTRYLPDGNERTPHITTAVRECGKYAFLICRRISSLDLPLYDLRKQGRNVVLAKYDPKNFTCILAIFVGAPGMGVDSAWTSNTARCRVKQIAFKRFSLIFVWSFIPWFSHQSSHTLYSESREDIGPTRGRNPQECVELFDSLRVAQREEFARTFSSHEELAPFANMIRNAEFLAESDESSLAYDAALRRIAQFRPFASRWSYGSSGAM